ncbi:MAG: PucR family transcriptional regulator [Xanthobacteraceae bacterium]
MSGARANSLIRQWSQRFQNDPSAAGIVAALSERGDAIWQHAFALLQRESPEYRNAVDAEFAQESKAHCNELLRMIVTIAAGSAQEFDADPFDFVRRHAAWRARHQVPLIASLHAYRLAHRTYSEITRDSVLRHPKTGARLHSLAMLSDFWIQFFDHVGTVLAEAHAAEEGHVVAQGTRSYISLIDDLLRGVEPRDAEAQRLRTLCGIRSGAPMAVAIASPHRGGSSEHVDLDVALRSFVRLIDQVLPPAAFGRLVGIRGGEVIIIACSEANTARELMQVLRRSEFARRAGNGHAARVGVGADIAEVADFPQALEEARIALEFASAAQPLMHFPDIDLPEFLLRRADSAAFRLIPEWAGCLHPTDTDQSHALLRTIHTFAECSFNVKKTARRLRIHANTVYFRLNRIKKLTGVDPRTFSGTSLLLTAFRLRDISGGRRSET